jgi:hypothetical protein
LPIFKIDDDEDPLKVPEVIDLNFYENEDDPFFIYLNQALKCYENELSNLKLVFHDYGDVLKIINKRLAEDFISTRLERFLKFESPNLYLINLKNVYKKTKTLCSFISSLYPIFQESSILNEVFDPCLCGANGKEKEALDEVYDILVRKKRGKHNFILMGDPLFKDTHDGMKVFRKLMCMVNFSMERKELFVYDKETTLDICKHFTRKISEFVHICLSNFIGKDPLEAISLLSNFYLIFKKYFSNFHEVYEEVLNLFSDSLGEKIQELFEEKAKECEKEIRLIIRKQKVEDYSGGINGTPMMRKLIRYLKEKTNRVSIAMPGRNSTSFLINIFNFLYLDLYNHILKYTFDEKMSKTLLSDMRSFVEYAKGINCAEIIPNFEYLCEIAELLCVDKSDINLFLGGMFHKIPHSELKKILKCRSDYSEIRSLVHRR